MLTSAVKVWIGKLSDYVAFQRGYLMQGGLIVQQEPDAVAYPSTPDQITAVCAQVGDDWWLTGLSSPLGAGGCFQARVFRPVATGAVRANWHVLRVVTVEPLTLMPVLLVAGAENPFLPGGTCRVETQWYPDNNFPRAPAEQVLAW